MRVLLVALFAVLCLCQLPCASAVAYPGAVEQFPVPTVYMGEMRELAFGAGGNIWITQAGGAPYSEPGAVEEMEPDGQAILPYDEGEFGELSPESMVLGPEGDMWFDGNYLLGNEPNVIGQIVPGGKLTVYPVPAAASFSSGAYVDKNGLAFGPDGAIWFTEEKPDEEGKTFIGRITTAGVIKEFPVRTGVGVDLPEVSEPVGIAAGPEGDMWFTDQGHNSLGQSLIGRITPAGVVSEFPVPTLGAEPTAIALGADGNMWFTEPGAEKVARITPAGVVSEFPVPSVSSAVDGIVLGPDGNMWFGGRTLGWITPAGIVRSVPQESFPAQYASSLTVGASGDIWFTDPRGSVPMQPVNSFVDRFTTPFVPSPTAAPRISGEAVPASVLSVSEGSWANEPATVAYQWQRCDAGGANCSDLSGASSAVHGVSSEDLGHTLRALVMATNLAGSGTATSALTAVVSQPPGAPPAPPATPEAVGASARLMSATITWRFSRSGRDTAISKLSVQGLPRSAVIELLCSGSGCPFVRHQVLASSQRSCIRRRCASVRRAGSQQEASLAGLFAGRRLPSGARVTVSVAEAGWIGRAFVFAMRADAQPAVSRFCLAPGSLLSHAPC
jgi:streptogramin lyase